MLHRDDYNRNWKDEQITYFRKYLKAFDKNSKEYKLIREGIEELERSI